MDKEIEEKWEREANGIFEKEYGGGKGDNPLERIRLRLWHKYGYLSACYKSQEEMMNEKVATARIIKAAKNVFSWYYIFGEDNDAAKEHLAELGNVLQEGGYLHK